MPDPISPPDSTLVLRALAGATPDLIYALDRAGHYTFVSEPAARVLGLSPDEMLGRTWQAIGLAADREGEFVEERERVMASGVPSKREVTFPTATGLRTFEYVVSPLADEEGRAHGVIVVSRDITQRVATERALREQLRFREAVGRSLAPGIVTFDTAGKITSVSASFTHMTGFTEAGVVGGGAPLPWWPPEEQERIGAVFAQAIGEGNVPPTLDLTFQRSSGQRFPVTVQPSPLRADDGSLLGWVVVVTDVTEQRRSERRYRDLADAMPQIVWTATADGEVDYYNRRWQERTGMDSTATGTASWSDFIHPEDLERVTARWRACVASGEPFECEYRFLDKAAGDYCWHLGRALPARDEHSGAVRWYGTSTDIEDLKRSASMLETLHNVSRTLSAELDLQTLVQEVTDATTQLSGAQFGAFFYNVISDAGEAYTLYTISGVPREAFSRFPMPRNTAVFAPTFAGHDVVRSDDIRKDPRYGKNSPYFGMPAGHLPVVSYLAVPVVSKSGEVIGGLFFGHGEAGVFTQEAERVVAGLAAQAAIAIDNARLLDAARRADAASSFLADASALLTSSLDPETILTRLAELAVPRLADYCTVDVAREGGYERLIIAHHDPGKRAMVVEADRVYRLAPELDPVAHVLSSGKAQLTESVDVETLDSFAVDERHREILHSLGLRAWILVPILSGGKPYGVLGLVSAESGRRYSSNDLRLAEDIAARAGVAVDNAQLYLEAQAANRAKDEFLATLSHELRTPMTSILGWARMLQMEPDDPQLTAEAITAIERSSRMQAQLIDDLLDVSRISVGKLHLETSPVDLGELVESAVDAVRPAARAKHVSLQLSRDALQPKVNGDANRLQQVVWNVVNNAVKFTPSGGRVDVRVTREGATARVRVSDNGEGIAPEFLPFLFDRFRQADSTTTRRFGGLGLGLAIVKQITELHGGDVTAESEGLGRGATFTVTLPLLLENTGVEAGAAGVTHPAAAERLDGLDVLVVDDDPHARRFVAAALERAGAGVRVAGSADEALIAIRRAIPSVLVSDIAMPHRDGVALIEDVRNVLRIGDDRMPAVAITAFGRTGDRLRILAAGFQRYLLKPVDPRDLTRTVGEMGRKG